MSKKNKNSLLIGGLVSSAGMFITKAIGILYVVPFKNIVTSQNYVYYAAGYELYELLLTISLAGLPFAIAAIVSKYMEKEDYQTVLLVKKISQSLLAVFGFISATVVFIFINQFVGTRGQITVEEAAIYKNVYLLMSLSIFTVPILSSYRGFFQGIKNYNAYSISQVVEQIVRVLFLLGAGAFVVYVLNMDRVYAVYMALIATALSAVSAIFYLRVVNRDSIENIEVLAINCEKSKVDAKEIIVELFYFALPFLISVLLTYRNGFANIALLPKSLFEYGYSSKEVALYTSLITNESIKLIGIPLVFSTGFAVALVPEMSEASTRNDYKGIQKGITNSIESVLYIGLPILLIMYLLSQEVYFMLFGGDLELIKMGGNVLKGQIIIAIIGNLNPILNAILMTLNLKIENIKILALAFVLNFIALGYAVSNYGWIGWILAVFLISLIVTIYSFYILIEKYRVDFKYTIRKVILMSISLLLMCVPYILLNLLEIDIIGLGRIKGLFVLGLYGILMLIVYLFVSNIFYLPQSILNIDLFEVLSKVIRRENR